VVDEGVENILSTHKNIFDCFNIAHFPNLPLVHFEKKIASTQETRKIYLVDYCFFFLFRLAIALSVLQTFLQIVKYLLQVFLFTIGDIPLFAWFS
jgi:hypothetical protein